MGDSAEDCEAQKRELIEAGQAYESDDFISIIIVDPPARPDGLQAGRTSTRLA
jgi:hypothetical protein